MRDGYLLLSIGDTSEHLAALGKGKLLADRPRWHRCTRRATNASRRSVTSARSSCAKAGDASGQFDDLVNMAKQGLPFSGLEEKLQKELIADAEALAADLKKAMPKPGAVMDYSLSTPRGYEGYTYDWSEHKGVDGSKPLSILDHVGGNPISFIAGRGKSSAEDYQLLTKWGTRAVVLLRADRPEGARRETARDIRQGSQGSGAIAQAARLDDHRHADASPGRWARRLRAGSQGREQGRGMPGDARREPSRCRSRAGNGVRASAMRACFTKAFGEYYAIGAGSTRQAAQGRCPTSVPEDEAPGPRSKQIARQADSCSTYDLPGQLGLDKQIAPNAGLTAENVAVLFVFAVQPERLLTPTPPPSPGRSRARGNRPWRRAVVQFRGAYRHAAPVDRLRLRIAGGLQIADEGEADLGQAGLVLQADRAG